MEYSVKDRTTYSKRAIENASHPCHIREIVRRWPRLVVTENLAPRMVAKVLELSSWLLSEESRDSLQELLWEIEEIDPGTVNLAWELKQIANRRGIRNTTKERMMLGIQENQENQTAPTELLSIQREMSPAMAKAYEKELETLAQDFIFKKWDHLDHVTLRKIKANLKSSLISITKLVDGQTH